MFRTRRQIRRLAARVLLGWVFGIVTGVANACWMDASPQTAGHQAHAASTQGAILADAAAPECETHPGPDHVAVHAAPPASGESHAESVCQTYCDGFSASIPAQKKSPVDTLAVAAGPAATFAVAPAPAGASRVHLLMPRRDAGQAAPVRIAFVRLAL